MNKTTLQNIGAIFAGFFLIIFLSVVTDIVLESIGVFPSFAEQAAHGLNTWYLLLFALIYRILYAVCGGFITAKLSTTKPMKYVLILVIIGTVLGTLGAIANWSKTSPGSLWYPILLIPFSSLGVWIGGKAFERKKEKVLRS